MASPLFKRNDIVKIVSDRDKHKAINLKYGVVLGAARNASSEWSYMIEVCEDDACGVPIDGWSISEKYLANTERVLDDKEVYGGQSICITENGKLSH